MRSDKNINFSMIRKKLLIQQLITSVLLFRVYAQHGSNSSGQNEMRKEIGLSTLESDLTSVRNSAIWPTLTQSTVNNAPMTAVEAKSVLRTYSIAKEPLSSDIVSSQSDSTKFLSQPNSKPKSEITAAPRFNLTAFESESHHQPMLTATIKTGEQFVDGSSHLTMQSAEITQLRVQAEDSRSLPETSSVKLSSVNPASSYQNNAFEDDAERIDEEDDSSSNADSVSFSSSVKSYIKSF